MRGGGRQRDHALQQPAAAVCETRTSKHVVAQRKTLERLGKATRLLPIIAVLSDTRPQNVNYVEAAAILARHN